MEGQLIGMGTLYLRNYLVTAILPSIGKFQLSH